MAYKAQTSMTKVHVLTLTDNDGDVLAGVYSTKVLAQEALIAFVAKLPIDPVETKTCPEDKTHKPMAFELAIRTLTTWTEYRWSIDECEVDAAL